MKAGTVPGPEKLRLEAKWGPGHLAVLGSGGPPSGLAARAVAAHEEGLFASASDLGPWAWQSTGLRPWHRLVLADWVAWGVLPFWGLAFICKVGSSASGLRENSPERAGWEAAAAAP